MGGSKTISQNLIYLTRYNIESYYCSTNAIIRFLRSSFRCTRKEIESRVNLDNWRHCLCCDLGKLFILFAVVNRYHPTLQNVTLGPGKFLDKNGQLITQNYIDYFQKVSEEIGDIAPLIDEVTSKISLQFEGSDEEKILSIICGKYQFESLCRMLSVCYNKNINRENFRNSLISNFDLDSLYFLKDKILQLYADAILKKTVLDLFVFSGLSHHEAKTLSPAPCHGSSHLQRGGDSGRERYLLGRYSPRLFVH